MKRGLKAWLIGMTLVAVISDSMLIPFYPQFFADVYGIDEPQAVGLYLAAVCLAVMLSYPLWARLSRRVPALCLLIPTQAAAGVLSLLCYGADTIMGFWILSLAMVAFKGSYLLIYPLIMRLESPERHGNTIGLLSVVVHFGAIFGALAGGFVLQLLEPRQAFMIMTGGDFIQMLVCIVLVRAGYAAPVKGDAAAPVAPRSSRFIYRLTLVMLLFYFSAFLIRPFFARYWEMISTFDGEILSGLVFAIPAAIALLGLRYNRHRGAPSALAAALLPGIAGLVLQASQQEVLVLLGRGLFGWSLFQVTVRLDLLLFERSSPEAYATDFSRIQVAQSLGVLLASWGAGALVDRFGLQLPFWIAAGGLVVTLLLSKHLLRAGPDAAPATLLNSTSVTRSENA
ncbi:MFS transporter [Marinobacterium rhizophilum]|uniref:MFS transporter n=1 Tax=Marinobacterium rhizophilum TaxID=420402 RepID=UPI00036BCAFC|nr:MFS transporter [Marinobacterium rhizophilum]